MSCEHLVMSYSTFSKTKNDALKEPMFFGQPVNVARYDQQKYEVFEKLIEKQLSFFWRPEEIDVSRDRIDYANLPEHEKHIFISNLKYQTLLDSIQGRSPNVALLPLVSIPELETWIETWSFSETIHSRSYTHIIRNIVNDPSVVFDDIVQNEYIIARAEDIACYYDDLIEYTQYYNLLGEGAHNIGGKLVTVSLRELKKKLYLCLMCVNVLEAIRFYVSFAGLGADFADQISVAVADIRVQVSDQADGVEHIAFADFAVDGNAFDAFFGEVYRSVAQEGDGFKHTLRDDRLHYV